MKFFLFVFVFVNLSSAFAAEIKFESMCTENQEIELVISNLEYGQSVGHLTIQTLEENNIPFIGSSRGINSIFVTPIGQEAIEVISDNEIKAYGWCYSVNGFEPALYPDQIIVQENDKILWWYGYAHYKDGEWIKQCEKCN